jgi:hypothetical protein
VASGFVSMVAATVVAVVVYVSRLLIDIWTAPSGPRRSGGGPRRPGSPPRPASADPSGQTATLPRYGTAEPGYGTAPQPYGSGGTGPGPAYGNTGPSPARRPTFTPNGQGSRPESGNGTGPSHWPESGNGTGPSHRPDGSGQEPRPYGTGTPGAYGSSGAQRPPAKDRRPPSR